MLKNYSKSRIQKMSKFKFADITEPLDIKIYWMNCVTLSNDAELINAKMHSHSFYEVHFILKGSAEWKDEANHDYHVLEEQGILFAPGIRHQIGTISHEMFRLTLAFSPKADSALDTFLSQKDVHCFAINSRIIDCIDTILLDVEAGDFYSQTLIKNRIFEIINEIVRSVCCNQKYIETAMNTCEEDPVILKVKKYIADNMNNPLTCKEVADNCHFNEKYLSRLFAKKTGQTLLTYIHNEKIKYAEVLLKDQSLTLKQISEMLGFANEYYFSNFFKRLSGYSPSTFRQLTDMGKVNN